MRRITSDQLNAAHAAYVLNPSPGSSFWQVVSDWVTWCSYGVPLYLRTDLVQAVVLEVYISIHTFRPGTNFKRWVSSILRNVRSDMWKRLYREADYIVTGVDDLPDHHAEPLVPVDEESEALKTGQVLDALALQLKKPADKQLFDLLRQGHTLESAAVLLDELYRTTQSRFLRLRAKFDLHPVPEKQDITVEGQ